MSPPWDPTTLSAAVPAVLAATAILLWASRPTRYAARALRSSAPVARSPDLPRARDAPATADGRQARLRLAAAGAAGLSVWALAPGGWGWVAAMVAAVIVWRRSRGWEAASVRRRRLRLEAELPWVVDLLGSALSTGLGPVEALSRVVAVCPSEVRGGLEVPLARLRLGVDPVSVWAELAGHEALGPLGVALRRATESGAPVVEALGRLAEDLRASRRAAVEVRVRRIEVRAAVPLGVCLLPAFVLLAVVPLVAGSAARLLTG